VAPSRMVSVSASVNLPCTIKSRSSLLAPAHPGGPGKRTVKRLWCGGGNIPFMECFKEQGRKCRTVGHLSANPKVIS